MVDILKQPYLLKKLLMSKGRKIKQSFSVTNEETPRIIDPRNAFIMSSLLKEVINTGTARKAKTLKRTDIAGKTGTTNELVMMLGLLDLIQILSQLLGWDMTNQNHWQA